MRAHIHRSNKNDTNELIYKMEMNQITHIENTFGVTKGESVERGIN